MGWTKRDIVKQAFSEIGKSDYDFDIQPEEMMSALRSLDSMVSTWGAQGIRIGYAGGNGFGDIDADVEVPEFAHEALFLNLALRIAPSIGKSPSPETRAAATSALNAIRARSMRPRTRVLTGYAGAGSFGAALPAPETNTTLGADGNLEIGEEI